MSIIKVLPISSGQASGRLIHYQSHLTLQDYAGKIVLIENFDSSEIIPLFKKAKGVIAERGGITSHGAVLLREFGVTSVLLPNAREFLEEGLAVSFSDEGLLEIDKKSSLESINPLENLQMPLIKKGQWVLSKPRAKSDTSCRFTSDFVEPGYLATSPLLLGVRRKAEMKFDKEGIWIKNHPLPHELAKKVVGDKAWFKKHIKLAQGVFKKVRVYEQGITKKLKGGRKFSAQEAYQEILKCQNCFTMARPYVFLFAYAIDILDKEFYKLVLEFLPMPKAVKFFDQVARSAYAEKIRKLGIEQPRMPKGVRFPPSPLKFISAQPNYFRQIKLADDIKKILKKQQKDFQKKFSRYLEVMPTMVEFNDEICYLIRYLIASLASRFLLIIAEQSLRAKLLKKEEDILQMSIKEIAGLLKQLGG